MIKGGILINTFVKLIKTLFTPKVFPSLVTIILILSSIFIVSSNITDNEILLDRFPLNIHQKPATDAKVIQKVSKESKLKAYVLDETDFWYHIRINDHQTGWIAKWYLNNTELPNETDIAAIINKDAKLYEKPKADSQVTKNIPKDTRIEVTKEMNGWSRINFENVSGYVPTKDLNFIPKSQLEIRDEILIGDIDISNTDHVLVMRSPNSLFLDAPSLYANIIYQPEYNQTFEFIEEVTNETGINYYLVKDKDGTQGYLEARVTSFASDSKDHVSNTKANALNEATIVIDPGHGADDSGATSNLMPKLEKEINLQTSLILKSKLEETGANVIMTRTEDTWMGLDERAMISNEQKADVFLSIHYDAHSDSSLNGTTTYYFHEGDYDLANAINSQLKNLTLNNQGTAFGNYQVLRDNQRPSLLLELGYMTNPDDVQTITNESYYNQVTENIVNGLENYFNNKQMKNAE